MVFFATIPSTVEAQQRSQRGTVFNGILLFVGLPALLGIVIALVIVEREHAARNELSQRLDKLLSPGLAIDDTTMLDFTNALTDDSNAQTRYFTSTARLESTRAIFQSFRRDRSPKPRNASESNQVVGTSLAERADHLAFRESLLTIRIHIAHKTQLHRAWHRPPLQCTRSAPPFRGRGQK